MDRKDWVDWFRHASPYINAHRNNIHVIALSGDALASPNLEHIIHDLALLSSLGVKLVLVYGARPQIESGLALNNIKSEISNGLRITSEEAMPHVLEAYGRLRLELEARFSVGVSNSPMQGASIDVVSGNYVLAKPIGVHNGIDYAYTGRVRKVNSDSIHRHLDSHQIVLVPAVGYSLTGEVFNLSYEDLASEMAVRLEADKLILMGSAKPIETKSGELIAQLTVNQTNELLAQVSEKDNENVRQLTAAASACAAGVNRVHMLSYQHDGALLEELFTRDGIGTLVSVDSFEQIRPACLEDINGIMELIGPLEQQGYLVRRSRELLETELDYFVVDVRDNVVIGCAALYPFSEDDAGELSCFAVADAYRREGRGDNLLEAIMCRAKSLKLSKIFVLTTQTEHWFKERGFEVSSASELPGDKSYNFNRNAKVLIKTVP